MKRTLALLLSLTALATAQEPPAPPSPGGIRNLPKPGAEVPETPGTKTPLPQGINTGKSLIGNVDPDAIALVAGQSVETVKITGVDVAELVLKHSGKRVILSSAAAETEVSFYQQGPLTNRELMNLLKKTLLMEGLNLVQDPHDPNIVKLLPSSPNIQAGATPMVYIDDPLDLPVSDELVIYRMQFKSLKPEEALRIFQSVMGQLSPSGKISAVTNASSVIITENSSLIRQLLKIKEDIDKGSLVEDRWVHITYADVDEIAQQLNEIYNQQRGNSTTRTSRARSGNSAAPPTPGGGATGGSAGEDVPINIIPDNRTSRLLIIGRPSDLNAVEKLIRSYDVPSDPRTDFRYQLRYLRVNEFIPIAYSAIERTLGGQSQGGGGNRLAGGNNRSTNRAGQNNNQNRNNRTTGQRTGGSGGGGSRSGGGSFQAQEVPTEPTAEIVGKTLLVADNVANAVIVQGPPHHIEIVKGLIKELDTAAKMVVLSAVIGSYEIGDSMNFGVDLAHLLQGNREKFHAAGASSFHNPSVISRESLNSFTDLLTTAGAAGSGVSIYGYYGDDFGFFVNALEAQGNFKTLERPVITTRNNRVATITSGQRIAVPASSFTGGSSNGTTTNVEYRDVVLELEIQPLINSDNEVTLEIALVRDSIGNDRVVSADLTVPDINSETLTSSVTVPNGAAIILGGLITEENRKSKSGVPFLSRVPGLGRLFGRTTDATNRKELVILLRPEIISNSSDVEAFNRSFERDASIARDARRSLPATSAGMLPPQGYITPTEASSKSGVASRATTKTTKKKTSSTKKKKRKTHGSRRRR